MFSCVLAARRFYGGLFYSCHWGKTSHSFVYIKKPSINMKHLPLLFCVLFAYAISVQAQKKNSKALSAAKPATVSGVVTSDKFTNKPVKLFKVSEGACLEIASAIPSGKGE